MKKKIIEEIYNKTFESNGYIIRFSDLPSDILPTDTIDIVREEAYFSENWSYDAFTELSICREREETDFEYDMRIKSEELDKQTRIKERYERYLKLKQEFEPDGN